MSATGITLQRSGYGGIEVFLLTEIPHNGCLYYGFEFSFVSEYRDVTHSLIKAALIAPNQVAFQLPSMNTQFTLDYEKVWEDHVNKPSKGHELYCPRTAQAHAICLNKLNDNPYLKTRIVVLTFPPSMVLSNQKYSPMSKDGILQHAPVPMSSKIAMTSKKEVAINNIRNVWRIIVEDDDAPKIIQIANTSDTAVLRMEAMMDKLGI